MIKPKITMHCLVVGVVQGVSFRAATQRQAKLLNITGWVRNLPNGSVELKVSGLPEEVLQLGEWLKKGPPQAKVQQISIEEVPYQQFTDFRITK